MMNRELRFKTADFRTENTNDGKMLVSGYVNLTGEFSDPLSLGMDESFVETIAPGAFTRALERAERNGESIEFLAEHDPTKILSSTRNKSLTLVEDNKGLYMSAIITPTTWGQDFYKLVSEGIIRNFSFGFFIEEDGDKWEFSDSMTHTRVINDLRLFEVSIVSHPAYPQSYVEARNLISSDEVLKIRKGGKNMSEEIEKRQDEEVKEESEKEESELVDVTGSIISIDQRLNKMDKKLDEVLSIFLAQDEEEEEQEEKEVEEEKQKEKEDKKEEIKEQSNEEKSTDKTDGAETKSKKEDRSNSMFEAIDKLIKEFDKEEEK